MAEGLEWMIGEIKKAESIERLNYLADIIKFDGDHKYPYAIGDNLEKLRQAWRDKKNGLASRDV
jgi:hypothetical protein